jgi:hypothetical protein
MDNRAIAVRFQADAKDFSLLQNFRLTVGRFEPPIQ